jgi:hypothetical protein
VLGGGIDVGLLPGFENDRAEMLRAWAVLGKQAGPVFGVQRNIDATRNARKHCGVLSVHYSVDSVPAAIDDAWVFFVQGDTQAPNASGATDISIAEVDAQ